MASLNRSHPDIAIVDEDSNCVGAAARLNGAGLRFVVYTGDLARFISIHRSLMDARGKVSPRCPKAYFRP